MASRRWPSNTLFLYRRRADGPPTHFSCFCPTPMAHQKVFLASVLRRWLTKAFFLLLSYADGSPKHFSCFCPAPIAHKLFLLPSYAVERSHFFFRRRADGQNHFGQRRRTVLKRTLYSIGQFLERPYNLQGTNRFVATLLNRSSRKTCENPSLTILFF